MSDALFFEGVIEVRHEFRAVVGEDEFRRFWQELAQGVESDGGVAAGLVGAAKAMAKRVLGSMKVNDEGKQSAADAVLYAGDGVAGEELQWFGL